MTTIHNSAKKSEIAKIVLMCGDPLRAKYFAEKYLTNSKLVNSIRGMNAYTGTIKKLNLKITIMGHGMGLDSIGIYAYELYKFYDVESIIRFGSAGSYSPDLKLGTVIIGENSWSESNYGLAFGYKQKLISAPGKLNKIASTLSVGNKNIKSGIIHSSMWFYKENKVKTPKWYEDRSILCVEMESYALYAIAKRLKKNALTVVTISDNIPTEESMSAENRQKGFLEMFDFVCQIAKEYEKQK